MTTSTKTRFFERFRTNPISMLWYVTIGSGLFITVFTAFIAANIAGHILAAPLLTGLSLSTLNASATRFVLAFFLASFVWATPYMLWGFVTRLPTPKSLYVGLPRYETWGLIAAVPALFALLIMWTSPLWAQFSPALFGGISGLFRETNSTNVLTFALLAVPGVLTFFSLARDKMRAQHNGEFLPLYTSSTIPSREPATMGSNNTSKPDRDQSLPPKHLFDDDPHDNTESRTDSDSRSDSSATQNDSFDTFDYDWQPAPDLRFTDVGGMDDLKQELQSEIVRPLTGDIDKYREFGVGIPNLLLYGPPGTGKTYIAKALAGELDFPYLKLSASEVTSKWINESGDRVAQLFREAEVMGSKHGYAIVFIDEIDALLAARDLDHQHSENKKVVNEFLNYLSETGERNTLFIGATNHIDELDSAATRSGRIDKKVFVGLPDLSARVAILKVHLSKRPGPDPSDEALSAVAEDLDGWSAADIEQLVEDAARKAIEEYSDGVLLTHVADVLQTRSDN